MTAHKMSMHDDVFLLTNTSFCAVHWKMSHFLKMEVIIPVSVWEKGYAMNDIVWNMNTLLQMCKKTHNIAS
jgi:hypothetical protein